MDGWCLLVFAAPMRPFCPFANKTVRGRNLHRTHHQLCIPLPAGVCLNITYMLSVDEWECGCVWVARLEWGHPFGGEGGSGWAGRPSHRIRRNPNGGVGGERAMAEDSKSDP